MWDESTGRLRVVDIGSREIHSIDPVSGAVESVHATEKVTAIVPWQGDRWLAVFVRSIGEIDMATGAVEPLIDVPGPPDVPLNDAVCGRDGRIYVGSIDRAERTRGALYAIDRTIAVSLVAENMGAANGVDTSPDGTVVYAADSYADTVSRGTGDPIAVPHPDGLTVDSVGHIWVALWGAGEVRRFDPLGRLERTVPVPVPNVTSVAFGGAHFETLFIATARSAGMGLSGAVFQHRPGILGLAPARFGGGGRITG